MLPLYHYPLRSLRSRFCFGNFFSFVLPDSPKLTINILSSSAISPIAAIVYMGVKQKYIPSHIINRETFFTSISGIMLTWLVCLIEVFIFGPSNAFIKQIISTASLYYYINIFWFLIWGPSIEEIFFRGYIYEKLRSKGELVSCAVNYI